MQLFRYIGVYCLGIMHKTWTFRYINCDVGCLDFPLVTILTRTAKNERRWAYKREFYTVLVKKPKDEANILYKSCKMQTLHGFCKVQTCVRDNPEKTLDSTCIWCESLTYPW